MNKFWRNIVLKALKRKSNKNRKRIFNGLEMGSKVGLLYSKTQSIEELNIIQNFHNHLVDANVVVYYVLFNYNKKKDLEQYPVNYLVFGVKDFSLLMTPKPTPEFDKMKSLKLDYLINCNTTNSIHCTALFAHSNAAIKVGLNNGDMNFVDLSVSEKSNDLKSNLTEVFKRLKELSS